MDCGQSLLIPPLLDGINYAYWKVHMKVFLQALGEQVWQAVRSEERRVGKECVP